MAIVQLRRDTDGRRYYRRKLVAGKSPLEALRCLKRRLSNVVHQQMIQDAQRIGTGPGGQAGATLTSSAAGSIPTADTSEKPLPGPVTSNRRTRGSDPRASISDDVRPVSAYACVVDRSGTTRMRPRMRVHYVSATARLQRVVMTAAPLRCAHITKVLWSSCAGTCTCARRSGRRSGPAWCGPVRAGERFRPC
jgi:hypothetical protein